MFRAGVTSAKAATTGSLLRSSRTLPQIPTMCVLRLTHFLWLISAQLEYDTERAGSFEPLRWLPPNKSVVLGIVSSKLPALEDKDELVKKVHAAAEVIADGEQKRSKEEALSQCVVFIFVHPPVL